MTDASSRWTVTDNEERKRFEVDLGDGSFAFVDYDLLAGKIVFPHTEVPPEHEGQGIGTALVEAALDSARKRGLEVIPACPFVAHYIRQHPETQDLLDPSYRKVLGLD